MSSLIELAERVERLTGPCRETDGAIALAMGWTFQKMKGDSRAYYREPGVTEYYLRSDVPNFTGSFDAAMTLVPEGWDWCLSVGGDEPAHVAMSPAGQVTEVSTCAATPTLALCAAAIRAIDGAR